MNSSQIFSHDLANLEMSLRRYDLTRYTVDLRFMRPSSDAENQPLHTTRPLVSIDFAALRACSLDPQAYGTLLSASLFADPALRAAFAQARGLAGDCPLRLRLAFDVGAPELHALRWELLHDPNDRLPLSLSSQVLFSRYLASDDWRAVYSRARGDLRALVVIAAPNDLDQFGLAPIDVHAERARAAACLGSIPSTILAGAGQATLTALVDTLREGVDLLYLVAHGALHEGSAHLWLEDAKGASTIISADELVMQMRMLPTCPRLALLISCQSAGNGCDDPLEALGPRLTEAGVPAVVAMQGNFSLQSAAIFAPRLMSELLRDGQIDRAVAVARSGLGSAHDAWMPVLFSRLKSGRLWYLPGFTGPRGFKRWPAITSSITKGRGTAILGPGLLEPILGTTRTIARHWADRFSFPLAPHEREALPQVAQFLAVTQDVNFPRDQFSRSLRQALVERYGGELTSSLCATGAATLNHLINEVGTRRCATITDEPHRVLAELPFRIYLTTNPDSLLEAALWAQGREPQVALCPWNDYIEQRLESYDDEPTEQRPLVYHLFGTLDEPESLVLTEDDYFDFLIGVTRHNHLIPHAVRMALADSALLFLGFALDDWNFRVLFRSLMRQEGRSRRSRYAHVGVQITPDEGRITAPEQARHYLESYFQGADISIYWGSSEEFVRELREQMQRLQEQ
ncbi:MAG: CHAT domain-containing protein [Candidatus Viridilinea halotolerans]|uniref:CHAT domain-containing protein n=1 Tax=Candidatus Viridilinea halotolerans TaxID=2491704 RepID=A0A426U138_9CHLR|nr:MAG: CHAT domain-containing protein [Candidatus Viridilinea halotolerans]